MGDSSKTLTAWIMDHEGKDPKMILLCIAHNLENTSRSIEEINQNFDRIAERLKAGDKTMAGLQKSIHDLPCKLTSQVCQSPRPPWGKAKVAAAGSVIATVVLVIVETVKRLMS